VQHKEAQQVATTYSPTALSTGSCPDNKSDLRLRTVVVDDSPEFREVVCAIIEFEDSIDVIARASSGSAALQAVCDLAPDLVLMDVNMPDVDGLTAAHVIRESFSRSKVVLMSAENCSQLRSDCWRAGALAFVHKANLRQELARAIAILKNQHNS
jgi:DNA-binding NarL/FixJ family response regulator